MEVKAKRICNSFEKLKEFSQFCCQIHNKVASAKKKKKKKKKTIGL